MEYAEVIPGIFRERPNRFIAHVEIQGQLTRVHVKNTGRCRELLLPGSKVYLAKGSNPQRKTPYDLVAVEKLREGQSPLLINMDSQIPNDAVEEFLKKDLLFPAGIQIRREVVYGESRFDFYLESGVRKIFLEVKGVTLEEGGIAYFPDAPTERGVKHLRELIRAVEQGFESWIFFVIQMKGIREFRPNDRMHPEFGSVLREAAEAGVHIIAYDSFVTPRGMIIDAPVPVKL